MLHCASAKVISSVGRCVSSPQSSKSADSTNDFPVWYSVSAELRAKLMWVSELAIATARVTSQAASGKLSHPVSVAPVRSTQVPAIFSKGKGALFQVMLAAVQGVWPSTSVLATGNTWMRDRSPSSPPLVGNLWWRIRRADTTTLSSGSFHKGNLT